MRHVSTPHPVGTVIVPTSGTPRYTAFYAALEALQVPAGSRLITTESCELAAALNKAVDQMLGEWIWFLGDDHTFDPTLLLRLLDHNLDVVVPLTVQRQSPFGPILLRGKTQADSFAMSWDEVPTGGGLWALPADVYTGQAGALVRKGVIDRVEKPMFRIGQYNPEKLNEDFYFNARIRELGIPHVVDTGAVLGHINSFAITPYVENGTWRVALIRNGQPEFRATPPAVQAGGER